MGGQSSFKYIPKPKGVEEKSFAKSPDIERVEQKEREQEKSILEKVVGEAGKDALEKSVVGGACALMPSLAPAITLAYAVYKTGQIAYGIRKTYAELDDSTKRRLETAILREVTPEAAAEALSKTALEDSIRTAKEFAETGALEVIRLGAIDGVLTALGMTPDQKPIASRIISETFSGLVEGAIDGTLKGAIKVALEMIT